MESFKGILIAATKLMYNLDQAALRCFDLKLFFDFLKPEQARLLLGSHRLRLGLDLPSEETLRRIDMLTTLTPGDFANIARLHAFRKFKSADDLLDELSGECRLKKLPARGPLGFG